MAQSASDKIPPIVSLNLVLDDLKSTMAAGGPAAVTVAKGLLSWLRDYRDESKKIRKTDCSKARALWTVLENIIGDAEKVRYYGQRHTDGD